MFAATMLVCAPVVVACATDSPDAAAEVGPASCHDPAKLPAKATVLDVNLNEWKVVPSASTIKAGSVNIVAHNIGTMTHELLVFRGDSEAALPHNADGSINEDAISAADTIGEISEFPRGTTCARHYDLAPGTYVLVCNIMTGDVLHAKLGMYTTLKVTA